MSASNTPRPIPRPEIGVEILGTGRYVPDHVLTNADLESQMDTSDEWIVQRTGISERRTIHTSGMLLTDIATEALTTALKNAEVEAQELDLLVLATVGAEMGCPSSACRIMDRLGGGRAGAFDLTAACSGFVYGLNVVHEMVRGGHYRTAAVIGAEHLTQYCEYSTRGRSIAIIFGDGAGAAVIRATDDASKGLLAQTMHSDGTKYALYIPRLERDFPEGEFEEWKIGRMQMNGRAVFKFAVTTFGNVISETLEKAGLTPDDIDHFVCHQSNVRILDAARERFGIPQEKLYVNIDRLGNTSAASVPICFDELMSDGKIEPGQKVMFVAFGGGLTWATSLWQL